MNFKKIAECIEPQEDNNTVNFQIQTTYNKNNNKNNNKYSSNNNIIEKLGKQEKLDGKYADNCLIKNNDGFLYNDTLLDLYNDKTSFDNDIQNIIDNNKNNNIKYIIVDNIYITQYKNDDYVFSTHIQSSFLKNANTIYNKLKGKLQIISIEINDNIDIISIQHTKFNY